MEETEFLGEKDPMLSGSEVEMDDEKHEETPDVKLPGRRGLKDLLLLSFSMFFIFAAFTALQALQSSLNETGGKGVACLAVLYGVMIASCVLVAPVLVGIFRPKWTLVGCFICHCVFTASNFYPQWYTLIPACALLGAASGPLWAAHNTYLTTLAVMHARAVKDKEETVIQQFNGIFFAVFQASLVGGNVVSALVFAFAHRESVTERENSSLEVCHSNVSLCVLDSTKYTLFTVFEVSQIAGLLLVLVALKTLKKLGSDMQIHRPKIFQLAASVVKLHKDVRVLLLLPITFYSGFEQAFIVGEYTKYFITDFIGVKMVGVVLIVFGVTNSISSYVSGKLGKKVGRCALILAGGLLNISLIVFLMAWTASACYPILFTVPVLWGIVDAISNTQTTALYGVLFTNNQEAAFGAYRFWQSCGFAVSFAYSHALRHSMETKLIIALCLVCISMAGYIGMEAMQRKRNI